VVVGSKSHGEGDARTWREWNMKFEPPELLRYFGEKRNEKGQRWRMDSEVYIWMTQTIAMQAFPSWQVDRREQVVSLKATMWDRP
jgi:transposase-like protein